MVPIVIGAIAAGAQLLGGIFSSIKQAQKADEIRKLKIKDLPKEAYSSVDILGSLVNKDMPGYNTAIDQSVSNQARTIGSIKDVVGNPMAIARLVAGTQGSVDRQIADINVKNSLVKLESQKMYAAAMASLSDKLLGLNQYNNQIEMNAISGDIQSSKELVSGFTSAISTGVGAYMNADYLKYLKSGATMIDNSNITEDVVVSGNTEREKNIYKGRD